VVAQDLHNTHDCALHYATANAQMEPLESVADAAEAWRAKLRSMKHILNTAATAAAVGTTAAATATAATVGTTAATATASSTIAAADVGGIITAVDGALVRPSSISCHIKAPSKVRAKLNDSTHSSTDSCATGSTMSAPSNSVHTSAQRKQSAAVAAADKRRSSSSTTLARSSSGSISSSSAAHTKQQQQQQQRPQSTSSNNSSSIGSKAQQSSRRGSNRSHNVSVNGSHIGSLTGSRGSLLGRALGFSDTYHGSSNSSSPNRATTTSAAAASNSSTSAANASKGARALKLASPITNVTATAAVNSNSNSSTLQQQRQQQQGDACTDAYADVYSGDSAEEYDAAVETCNRRTGWEKHSSSNSNSSSYTKLQSAELAAAKLQALESRVAVAAARQLTDHCDYAAAAECSLSGNAAEPDEYEVTELADDSMVSFSARIFFKLTLFELIRKCCSVCDARCML
jgi:hypothetical protein